ncbi:MAG: NUDIX hydrolase [bacterium]|nr:NUDIX hydrolase [bacterium]
MKRKHTTLGKPRTIFQGRIYKITEVPAVLPDGSKKIFELAYRAPMVVVLAFNAERELLVTREYRERYKKYFWHLPAGRAESKNHKKEALRELREETGYTAKTLRLLYATTAGYSWPVYAYVAKGLSRAPLPKELGEDITVVPMSLGRAERLALTGKFVDPFLAYTIAIAAFTVRSKGWKSLLR